jgi:hypothetical protein
MSDLNIGSEAGKPRFRSAGQGWTPAEDGASVSKTYKLASAGEAVKLAKRALQLAEKSGQPVKIDYSGSDVTVGLVAAGGAVADAERKLAKRLDVGKGGKAAKAAKPAKPPKPAKAAKSQAASPAKTDKAAERAVKAARPAKATPGSEA